MADDLDDVTDETSESSEALIAVHWREEGYYPPPAKFTAQANASDPAIREQFTEDKYPDCFTAYAERKKMRNLRSEKEEGGDYKWCNKWIDERGKRGDERRVILG